MKKITFILSLFFTISTQAAILHVGIGSAYPYNNLSDAYDAASNGDTLKVNSGNWGELNISKPITIIGTGYHVQENGVNLSNENEATFSLIQLFQGSEGSHLIGLYIPNDINITGTNNVVVERCYVSDLDIESSNNILVKNSYFYATTDPSDFINSNNVILTNNFFRFLKIQDNSFVTVKNNVIYNLSSICYNSTILNNIILDTNADIFDYNRNNTISYNLIKIQDAPSTANFHYDENEFIDYETEAVCIGYPEIGDYSFDARWQLAPNSLAIGAGEGGIDCGIFGGNDPYILSGLPPQPIIYELNVPLNADPTGLNVNLKAKTNN